MPSTTASPENPRVAAPAPSVLAEAARPAPSATAALSPAASFLLDLTRFSAALLVVAAHLTHSEFRTGMRERQILGDVAVPVFFVLSGFVIRHVTRIREHTLRGFLIDRAARIYSVALPAMLVTILLSTAMRHGDPGFYNPRWGLTSGHAVTRVLLNLTFFSQSWGHNTIPLLNSPFWSLSYECLYYAGFAFALYLRGWRRVGALALWALAAGPQVLFLLPVWASGCLAYDAYQAVRHSRIARVVSLILLAVLLPTGACPRFTFWFAALPHPLALTHQPVFRATLFAFATGLMATAFLLPLLILADPLPIREHSVWIRRFRHVADGTFSIYLLHYPLMALAAALGLYQPGMLPRNLLVTAAICIILILAARPMDLFKLALRGWLRRAFVRAPRSASSARAVQSMEAPAG